MDYSLISKLYTDLMTKAVAIVNSGQEALPMLLMFRVEGEALDLAAAAPPDFMNETLSTVAGKERLARFIHRVLNDPASGFQLIAQIGECWTKQASSLEEANEVMDREGGSLKDDHDGEVIMVTLYTKERSYHGFSRIHTDGMLRKDGKEVPLRRAVFAPMLAASEELTGRFVMPAPEARQ